MDRKLCIYEEGSTNYYRHFKGGWYKVIGTAIDTTNDSTVVVYASLLTNALFVRPIDEFLSPTDKKKYPEASQNLRMTSYDELIELLGSEIVNEMFEREVINNNDNS